MQTSEVHKHLHHSSPTTLTNRIINKDYLSDYIGWKEIFLGTVLAWAQLQHYSQLQPVKSTVIDFYIAIERSSHTSRFNIYNPWAQDTGGHVLSEPHAAACKTKKTAKLLCVLTGDTGKCLVEHNDAGWLSNAAAFFCVENKSLCILQEIIAAVSFGLNYHKSNWWVGFCRRTVWTLEKSLLLLHRRGKKQ